MLSHSEMKVTAEVFVGMEVNRKKKSPVLVSLIFVCMPVILYEEFNNIKHFKDNTHTHNSFCNKNEWQT